MENKPHISHSLFLDQIDLVSSRKEKSLHEIQLFSFDLTKDFSSFSFLPKKEYEL